MPDEVGEPRREDGQPGWPQVTLVAIAIVAVVLGIATVSNLVPGLSSAFAGSPLLIGLLIGGTLLVVWRILRAPTAP